MPSQPIFLLWLAFFLGLPFFCQLHCVVISCSKDVVVCGGFLCGSPPGWALQAADVAPGSMVQYLEKAGKKREKNQ